VASLQVLKRLIAYAKSSADLIVSLIKGEEDDSRWLVCFLLQCPLLFDSMCGSSYFLDPKWM
jgi:hypothetical protein